MMKEMEDQQKEALNKAPPKETINIKTPTPNEKSGTDTLEKVAQLTSTKSKSFIPTLFKKKDKKKDKKEKKDKNKEKKT